MLAAEHVHKFTQETVLEKDRVLQADSQVLLFKSEQLSNNYRNDGQLPSVSRALSEERAFLKALQWIAQLNFARLSHSTYPSRNGTGMLWKSCKVLKISLGSVACPHES